MRHRSVNGVPMREDGNHIQRTGIDWAGHLPMNRRAFIKKAGVVAALVYVSPTIASAIARPVYASATQPANLVLYAVDSATDEVHTLDPTTGVTAFVRSLGSDYTTPVAGAVRPSDLKLFVWNNSPVQGVGEIDTCSGAQTFHAASGTISSLGPQALAFSPSGALYLARERFWEINTSTYAVTEITSGTYADGRQIMGMDFDSGGTLYGLSSKAGNIELVTIDTSTGAVAFIGKAGSTISLGLPQSLVFAPDGALFGTSLNAIVFELNPATGARLSALSISGSTSTVQGMGYAPACP